MNEVPAGLAGIEIKMTREQVIRRVQRGELVGGVRNGSWFVERSSLDAVKAARRTEGSEPVEAA